MVVKIQKPVKDPRAAVNYNEDKMREIEKGVILGTRNVPEDKSIVDVYKERETLARFNHTRGQQIKNVSFHMSVNPSESDEKIGDERIVSMVDRIMKDLGYADQPYKIYKHTDIARTHYHVVSCRIDENGRKIPADFERMVLQNTLHKLEKEYGFKVGISNEEPELETAQEEGRVTNYAPEPVRKTGENKEKKEESTKPLREKPAFVRSFHQNKGAEPATTQMKDIFEDAIKWNFSTFEQMQALMLRRYNVLLERENAEGDSERAVVSGLRPNGTVAMKPLTEEELGLRMLERIRRRIEESNMAARREQRKRLEALAGAAARESKTYEEFLLTMERKGVYVVVSWTRDGEPFGVTYLDKATRCAWKGSETARDMNWLRKTAEEKGWALTRDRFQTLVEKRAQMPSRRRAARTYDDARRSGRQDASDIRAGLAAKALLDSMKNIHGGQRASGAGAGAAGGSDDDWDEDDEERRRKAYEQGSEPSM